MSSTTPLKVFAQLLPHLVTSAASADVPSATIGQLDSIADEITALYQFNAPQQRLQLNTLTYETHWKPLIEFAFSVIQPVLVEHQKNAQATPATHTGESDEDDEPELYEPTRLRLASLSRLFILVKNLCPNLAFQTQLRTHLISLPEATSFGPKLVECLNLPSHAATLDVKPAFKNLLQLYANMLTPAASSQSTLTAWRWIDHELYPRVLEPVLALQPHHSDLISIVSGILHHGLCCQNADSSYALDLHPCLKQATEECLQSTAEKASIFQQLLSALVVDWKDENAEELEADGDREDAPTELWHWQPESNQPNWFIHIISFCMRSSPNFLQQVTAATSTDASGLKFRYLLRCVELWSESLTAGEAASQEIQRMQLASGMESTTTKTGSLQQTSTAVAGNVTFLIQWLQQRPHVPLPVVVLPPSANSADSTSSSSSTTIAPTSGSASSPATSTIPIDSITNCILNIIGHILLFDGWERSLVAAAIRASLLLNHASTLLLNLLHAADTIDGGSMFSELYRPAGHTRHTKPSEDQQDYVNQFKTAEEKEAGAATEQKMNEPASAATPKRTETGALSTADTPARHTPYQFKSHVLRLIASLSFRHPGFQDSFGGDAVYACMNHSVLDDQNPLMREYSILALRNLLEHHPGNQKLVEELRVESIANQRELSELGVQTVLDKETGTIKVSKNQMQ